MTHVTAGAACPQDRARRLIRYWAVTLEDRNLSKGIFTQKALGDAYQSKEREKQVFAGQLEVPLTDRMFRGQTAEVEEIEVEIRPYLYEELGEPGRPRSEYAKLVAPAVVKAWLDRSGNLTPTGKVTIPRELLEPLGSDDDLAIGTLEDLYRYVEGSWS